MGKTLLNSGLNVGPHRARTYRRSTPPPAPATGVPEDLTTVEDLLGWVGEDTERAQVVLNAERSKDEDDQRSTLVEPLEALVAPAPEADAGETAGDGGTPAEPPAPETAQETQEPQAPAAPEPVQVPDDITKVKDLEQWVGQDPTRAQAVIDRENAGSYQRKTLLATMADIVVAG